MHTPTLLKDRTRSAQILFVGVIPAAIGALAGVLLGISSTAYWIVGALAAIGGFLAGFEHEGGLDGGRRGLIAGAIYGAALLLAHAIAGNEAKVSLGKIPILLIAVTAIAGMILTGVGALSARSQRERNAAGQTD